MVMSRLPKRDTALDVLRRDIYEAAVMALTHPGLHPEGEEGTACSPDSKRALLVEALLDVVDMYYEALPALTDAQAMEITSDLLAAVAEKTRRIQIRFVSEN